MMMMMMMSTVRHVVCLCCLSRQVEGDKLGLFCGMKVFRALLLSAHILVSVSRQLLLAPDMNPCFSLLGWGGFSVRTKD